MAPLWHRIGAVLGAWAVLVPQFTGMLPPGPAQKWVTVGGVVLALMSNPRKALGLP